MQLLACLRGPGRAARAAGAQRRAAAAASVPAGPGCAATCIAVGWQRASRASRARLMQIAGQPVGEPRPSGCRHPSAWPRPPCRSSPTTDLRAVSSAASSSCRCSSCCAKISASWLTSAWAPLVCTSSKNSCRGGWGVGLGLGWGGVSGAGRRPGGSARQDRRLQDEGEQRGRGSVDKDSQLLLWCAPYPLSANLRSLP